MLERSKQCQNCGAVEGSLHYKGCALVGDGYFVGDELAPARFGRAEILDTAKEYVTKDRAADHGDTEDNFNRIADYWSTHLGVEISAVDVAVMMSLLKIARIGSSPSNKDNWVDLAGYSACGGEIALKFKD